MKNKKLWLIISLGTILTAAVITAAILLAQKTSKSADANFNDLSPAPSAARSEPARSMEPEEALPDVPAPILYSKGGECYLACGNDSICLGVFRNPAGGIESPETALSGNNRYLFYLKGFDAYKGYGTLMRVSADAQSEPVAVAENVCAAAPSNGGKRVLYITEIRDGCGKLFLWDEKEGERFISDNVMSEQLVFSPHATCFCYIAREQGEARLYLYRGGEALFIKTLKDNQAAADYYGNDHFQSIIPDDGGKVLFSLLLSGLDGWPLCLYSEGKTETISSDARVEKLLGSVDNIVYAEQVSAGWKLYYKEPEKKSVLLSDNYKLADFADQPISENGTVFLLEEGSAESMAAVDIYEMTIEGQKQYIATAEYGALWSPNEKCVAYERDKSFYVSRKTDKGWKEERLCAVTYDEEGNSSVWSGFDGKGDYLCYFDSENDGPLHRYSTADGTIGKIKDNARLLYIFGDIPYVIDSKYNAFRVNEYGIAEQIGENIKWIYETGGGVYLADGENEGNVYFVADGTTQRQMLDSYEDINSPWDKIDYSVPLGEDKNEAAEILYNDSDYYLGKIEDYYSNGPYLTLEEDIALAKKLLERTDLEPEETDYLTKMLEGFRLYGQWAAGDNNKPAEAGSALKAAAGAYESYVYGCTGDDINGDDE